MNTHARFAALTLLLTTLTSLAMAKTSLVYIATQNPEKMGITVAEFDSATGRLSAPKMVDRRRATPRTSRCRPTATLYMCNTGTPGGVSAFAIDRKTGALRLLNYKESKGRGPSYVSVDGSGKYVLDANYGGGFVEVYSLAKDGSLDQQTAFVQHIGSSVHPRGRRSRMRTGSAPTPLTSSAWSPISAWTRSSSTSSTRRPAS